MTKLTATYSDSETGHSIDLEGETVEAIASQLPKDYSGQRLTVYDEPGFIRGWIHSRTDWSAK